jgi:hypothetical protein
MNNTNTQIMYAQNEYKYIILYNTLVIPSQVYISLWNTMSELIHNDANKLNSQIESQAAYNWNFQTAHYFVPMALLSQKITCTITAKFKHEP